MLIARVSPPIGVTSTPTPGRHRLARHLHRDLRTVAQHFHGHFGVAPSHRIHEIRRRCDRAAVDRTHHVARQQTVFRAVFALRHAQHQHATGGAEVVAEILVQIEQLEPADHRAAGKGRACAFRGSERHRRERDVHSRSRHSRRRFSSGDVGGHQLGTSQILDAHRIARIHFLQYVQQAHQRRLARAIAYVRAVERDDDVACFDAGFLARSAGRDTGNRNALLAARVEQHAQRNAALDIGQRRQRDLERVLQRFGVLPVQLGELAGGFVELRSCRVDALLQVFGRIGTERQRGERPQREQQSVLHPVFHRVSPRSVRFVNLQSASVRCGTRARSISASDCISATRCRQSRSVRTGSREGSMLSGASSRSRSAIR